MIPSFLMLPGWFDMETMMTFKRLRSLTEDPSVVLTAVAKSPRGLLQASVSFSPRTTHYFDIIHQVENWGHGKGRIRRNPDKPCPEYNEARRISMQASIKIFSSIPFSVPFPSFARRTLGEREGKGPSPLCKRLHLSAYRERRKNSFLSSLVIKTIFSPLLCSLI